MGNNDFKLIAIRPHKNCGQRFLKLLEPGRLYQFYNEYAFYTENGEKYDGVNGQIIQYELNKSVPDNLYKVGNLNINVSAVVGKNGTGKSTLIELFLYSIYLISRYLPDKNTGDKILPTYTQGLNEEISKAGEDRDKIEKNISDYENFINAAVQRISKNSIRKRFFKKRVFGYIEEIKALNVQLEEYRNNLRFLKREAVLSDEFDTNSKFYCTLYFVLDETLYEMNFTDDVETFIIHEKDGGKEKEKIENFDLKENFFYSTVLNYSHHSLNSEHVGYWINSLFHKNDGYKTPAVISPMREYGIIDMNKESQLAKSRLLVNSLINQLNDPDERVPLTEKQFLDTIQIKLKKNTDFKKPITLKWDNMTSSYTINGDIAGTNTIQEILMSNGEELEDLFLFGYRGEYLLIVENLLNYLVNKIHKIQQNYSEYFDKAMSIGIPRADQIVDDRNTVGKLNDDFSHVSFKYHRSLYFLKKIVRGELNDFFNSEVFERTLSLKDYLEKIDFLDEKGAKEKDVFQIFLRIPPPIFEINFNISHYSGIDQDCSFQDLSSGEQQSIHTVNAFIYHLNNTYSVHKESLNKRQKYHFFNAIFDEIELYFHPDLQRKFIDDLLRTIRNHSHLTKGDFIKGLNILFSTHSPFILSDIPEQNILQVEYKKSDLTDDGKEYSVPSFEKRQTFGANIHDLLSNSFFLSDSFKGAHFQQYFLQLVKEIDDFKLITTIEDYNYLAEKIGIVAEPFIKSKLFEKLETKFKNEDFVLGKKIEQMEKRVEDLKKEQANKRKKHDPDQG